MPSDEMGMLFTRATARRHGYSNSQIRHRIESGRWTVVIGPVLALGGLELTPAVRDRAASFAISGAVLSGASAARGHGLEVGDPATWVTISPQRRVRLKGIRVRREELAEDDIIHRDGVALTALRRTIFDCVRAMPAEDAERLLRRELSEGRITYEQFLHRVQLHVGRHGMAHLLTVVSRLAQARSAEPVLLLADRLRQAGVGGWRWAGSGVDSPPGLVFDSARLAIDVSPAERHRSCAPGWRLLRFTRSEISDRVGDVVTEITAARDHLLSVAGRG